MTTEHRIEDDVRAALERDPRITHPELIAVLVDGIGTVQLEGTVDSVPQRFAATHDAGQIEGVFGVIADDLTVQPPFPKRRADAEIRVAALELLIKDPNVHADSIRVKVSSGKVTLTGHVPNDLESARAAEDVTSLKGVVAITNHLKVR